MTVGRALKAFVALMMIAAVLVPASVASAQVMCGGLPATKVGTEGNDFLLGTPGPDVIAGLGGNDIIRGLDGNDVLCGGNGRDRLFGGFGNDVLEGGKKNDILKGDQGRDTLFGNQGNDRLFGGPGADVLEGGSGTRDKLFGKGSRDTCNDPQGTTIYDTCEVGDGAPGPAPTGPAIGSTQALAGRDTSASITVHNYLDPAPPASQFNEADEGHRLVAVLVSIKATSPAVFECAGNIFELRDSLNQTIEPGFNDVASGESLRCHAVPNGDVRAGWVVFELPNGVQGLKLQSSLDSGFANDVKQWDLSGGTPKALAAAVVSGPAGVGSTLRHTTFDDNVLDITLDSVIDPATPAGQFDQPGAGNRLVAAKLSVKNVGQTNWSGSVTSLLDIVTDQGFVFDPTFRRHPR